MEVNMKRQSVSSSNLKSVGYDAKKGILEIEFQNGRIYQYSDVSNDEYTELMEASSLGRYFNSCIRGAYNYARIR